MKPCGKWLCQAPGSLSWDGDSHEAWSTSSTEAGIKDVPGNSVLSLSLSNAFWSFIDSEWIPSDQSRWARFIHPIFGQGLKRMMMRDSNIWDRCHQPMYTFYFLSLCYSSHCRGYGNYESYCAQRTWYEEWKYFFIREHTSACSSYMYCLFSCMVEVL